MKLYIDGPKHKKEGVYFLISEEGEVLYSHYCSNAFYAHGDLIGYRTERRKEITRRFGDYTVLELGADEMTQEELVRRNKAFTAKGGEK
jgi:hypothetical protein